MPPIAIPEYEAAPRSFGFLIDWKTVGVGDAVIVECSDGEAVDWDIVEVDVTDVGRQKSGPDAIVRAACDATISPSASSSWKETEVPAEIFVDHWKLSSARPVYS